MSTAPLAIRDFARRIIALEAAREESSGGAMAVCSRFRVPLARLAGDEGFRSLMSRALAMAKAEVPSLAAVQVRSDGSLVRSDGTGQDPEAGGEAGVVVVAELLGLLVTFIGEALTLGLVRDAWPETSVTGLDTGSGEES